MGAVAEIFVALAFLVGAGDLALNKIHHEVRSAAVQKVQQGLPSLESYTRRLTGKQIQWHKHHQKTAQNSRKNGASSARLITTFSNKQL